jgi:hypothetical protein
MQHGKHRDHGELLNWVKLVVFSGFDTMPGCAMSSSFSFNLIVTVIRLARPGGLRSVVAESLLVNINYASSIAAASVLPTCAPQSVSSPVCAHCS